MANWYLQNGKNSDVVVSSRVRLNRNLNGFKFLNKCSKEEQQKILNTVKDIVPSLGYELKYISFDDLDDVTKVSLVEKHLISPEFAMNKENKKAILINNEENICIMLNEDEHIKLQVFGSGQELDNLMNLAVEIDEKLGEILEYSLKNRKNIIINTSLRQKDLMINFINNKFIPNGYSVDVLLIATSLEECIISSQERYEKQIEEKMRY